MSDEQEVWIPKAILGERERDWDGVKCRPMSAQGNESSRPIALSHTTIRRYVKGGIQSIRLAAMLAGQDERRYLPSTRTGAEADMALAQAQQTKMFGGQQTTKQTRTIFARGDEVIDTDIGKRAVILKTGVAFTEKGTPIHRVASPKTGEKWLQSEKKLRRK